MKIGFRNPSFKKRIAARTSLKRYIRHSMGLKMPRGWGWLSNPNKAAYNRLYYRLTIDPIQIIAGKKTKKHSNPKQVEQVDYQMEIPQQKQASRYIKRKMEEIEQAEQEQHEATMKKVLLITFICIALLFIYFIYMNKRIQEASAINHIPPQSLNISSQPSSSGTNTQVNTTPSAQRAVYGNDHQPSPEIKSPEEQIREMRAKQGESFIQEPTSMTTQAQMASSYATNPVLPKTDTEQSIPSSVYQQPPTYTTACPHGMHWVESYRRRDGTRVRGHCRH